jgi:hypothetical protein
MTLLWLVTGASLVLALAAWIRARRTARRLEQLSQMYWELKYQHGELRLRFERVSAEPPSGSPSEAAAPPGGDVAFIPIASLKR